jgi:hypothetical protein
MMRKQVILIMEGNQYPFGQADSPLSPPAASLTTKSKQSPTI